MARSPRGADSKRSSVLWRRLDLPGHEAARLFYAEQAWHLSGSAVFAYGEQPCRLDYQVVCDAQWHTVSAVVSGWVGRDTVEIELSVEPGRHWRLNDRECPEVQGCVDVDFGFSPSTNLLPIRRLALQVGQEAEAHAAWLRFPGLTLERLDQRYRRVSAHRYRYETADGEFAAELDVDEWGLVTCYPGMWQAEASAGAT